MENKARWTRHARKDIPYVSVEQGKVQIEIGEETRSYEPSCLTQEEAAVFLARSDVKAHGILTASSVQYTDSSKDGETYGADILAWLAAALERAVGFRQLLEVGVTPPALLN